MEKHTKLVDEIGWIGEKLIDSDGGAGFWRTVMLSKKNEEGEKSGLNESTASELCSYRSPSSLKTCGRTRKRYFSHRRRKSTTWDAYAWTKARRLSRGTIAVRVRYPSKRADINCITVLVILVHVRAALGRTWPSGEWETHARAVASFLDDYNINRGTWSGRPFEDSQQKTTACMFLRISLFPERTRRRKVSRRQSRRNRRKQDFHCDLNCDRVNNNCGQLKNHRKRFAWTPACNGRVLCGPLFQRPDRTTNMKLRPGPDWTDRPNSDTD